MIMKQTKILAVVLLAAMFISCITAGCFANDKDPDKVIAGIYGSYNFSKTIYNNPVSSFIPVSGQMPTYIIAANTFTLDYFAAGYNDVSYKAMRYVGTDLSDEKSLSIPSDGSGSAQSIDISGFSVKKQYALYCGETKLNYVLYVMDNEVWIAQNVDDRMNWLCKLNKADEVTSVKTTGNPVTGAKNASIPAMTVDYNNVSYGIGTGTASWSYTDDSGEVIKAESKSAHPLQWLGSITTIERGKSDQLTLNFKTKMDSYDVVYWSDDLLSYITGNLDSAKIEAKQKAADLKGNVLTLPAASDGYVFMVSAKWKQGNPDSRNYSAGSVVYAFHVTKR